MRPLGLTGGVQLRQQQRLHVTYPCHLLLSVLPLLRCQVVVRDLHTGGSTCGNTWISTFIGHERSLMPQNIRMEVTEYTQQLLCSL